MKSGAIQGGGFIDHVLELLAPLGRISARRMFGGYGLYSDGVFFGIVLDDTLYLKADAENRTEFENAGCEIFSYKREGRIATLNFYRAPDEALDAPHLMLPWARSALAAALRARALKPAAPSGCEKHQPAARRKPARRVKQGSRRHDA
jgi:DNA transformation protein